MRGRIGCDSHKSDAVQLPKLVAGLRENPAIEQTDDEFYLYMKVLCNCYPPDILSM